MMLIIFKSENCSCSRGICRWMNWCEGVDSHSVDDVGCGRRNRIARAGLVESRQVFFRHWSRATVRFWPQSNVSSWGYKTGGPASSNSYSFQQQWPTEISPVYERRYRTALTSPHPDPPISSSFLLIRFFIPIHKYYILIFYHYTMLDFLFVFMYWIIFIIWFHLGRIDYFIFIFYLYIMLVFFLISFYDLNHLNHLMSFK